MFLFYMNSFTKNGAVIKNIIPINNINIIDNILDIDAYFLALSKFLFRKF